MRTLVLRKTGTDLEMEERDDLVPGAGQVVVRLSAAALNRRDYWITQGKYPGIETPIVLGSDGAGLVTSTGPGVENRWGNRQVVINPGWFWGNCRAAQSEKFQILGMPTDGTFAEEVVVPEESVFIKPDHLDSAQAAALPLAGLTAYRALFQRAKIKAKQQILVTGVGGGVATFLVQFACRLGCSVFVTSSSEKKIEKAVALGAQAGFNYTQADWSDRILAKFGPMDVIIDGAAGQQYPHLIDLIRPGGAIVNYGATAGEPPSLDIFKVFWKQINLLGTTMGSQEDFESMLSFVSESKLQPVIDSVFSLGDANRALRTMATSNQFGKIVLTIES